ncbi:MAG: hypothetical protein HRF51_08045 [bacterium]
MYEDEKPEISVNRPPEAKDSDFGQTWIPPEAEPRTEIFWFHAPRLREDKLRGNDSHRQEGLLTAQVNDFIME